MATTATKDTAINVLTLSAAQRCHTDALHCNFTFLKMKELLPALQSCRSWNAAGSKELPRGLDLRLHDPISLVNLAASPLRHHVADLIIRHRVANLHMRASVSLDQLRQLRALPRLTALNVCLDADELKAVPEPAGGGVTRPQRAQVLFAAFPPQLHSFVLTLEDHHPASLRTRQMIVDALLSTPFLRIAKLCFTTDNLDLSPLLRLPQLSDLTMSHSPPLAQCAVIKQLAALTALRAIRPSWQHDALLELLRPPHALQRLQEVSLDERRPLDPPLLAALLSLPALTALQQRRIEPDCWSGLGVFTQLRTLHSQLPPATMTAAQSAALASTLCMLPLLTDVNLRVSFELPRALRLPDLRYLNLAFVSLPSLDFLQHSPLLETMQLVYCTLASTDELIGALTAHPPLRLLDLSLDECTGLDDTARSRLYAALDPPSLLLPQLKSFYFSEPDDMSSV